MNKKNGQLLVLGGFAGKTLILLINLIFNPGFLTALLGFVFSLAIAAGFAVIYLSEREILDLALTGGFGLTALTGIPSMLYYLDPYILYEATWLFEFSSSTIISLIYIVTVLVWAFKLYKKSQMIPAIAAAGSIGLIILQAVILSLVGPGPIFPMLMSLASSAALAVAAFLDYQS